MDKQEFLKRILEKQKDKSKIEHLERIEYLKNTDDKEYKELKKEIKEQIMLEETQINEDLEFLK
jgi:hypothetical protein